MRRNPPPEEFDGRHLALVKRLRGLKGLRVPAEGTPHGCGRMGCVWPVAQRGWVGKVTKDAREVKLIRTILAIRSGALKPRSPSDAQRAALKAVGARPKDYRSLPGFVAVRGPVRKAGRYHEYLREAVRPVHHGMDALERDELDDDLVSFWDIERSSPEKSLKRWVRDYPQYRWIARTQVILALLYGYSIVDLHIEQIGSTRKPALGRPAGSLVLYDGWIQRV